LTPVQAKQLFKDTLDLGVLNKHLMHELFKLTKLTPGDFAIVKRQMRFSKKRMTQERMLSILQEQNDLKEGGKQKIGFV